MDDWCSLSPDGFFGVDWSLSCMAHDGRYDTGKTAREKIQADIDLTLDIWESATLAGRRWKTAVIRAYSIGVLVTTSTAGWYFWFKAGDRK